MQKIHGLASSFKAGFIARRCHSGCVVKNTVNGASITPCAEHVEEITRLFRVHLISR